jgi:hypothetical protein
VLKKRFGLRVAIIRKYSKLNGQMQITVRLLVEKLREAPQSTSKRASPSLPIRCFGFGKATSQSYPFVWICWLLLLES